MKIAKIIGWIGVIAMTAALLNGFILGDFARDGGELLSNPWGVVSLVDLYIGFALFSIWIAFRETKLVMALVWIILMMVLGFFTGAVYLLVALYTSKGDWVRFFLGGRTEQYMQVHKSSGK